MKLKNPQVAGNGKLVNFLIHKCKYITKSFFLKVFLYPNNDNNNNKMFFTEYQGSYQGELQKILINKEMSALRKLL